MLDNLAELCKQAIAAELRPGGDEAHPQPGLRLSAESCGGSQLAATDAEEFAATAGHSAAYAGTFPLG